MKYPFTWKLEDNRYVAYFKNEDSGELTKAAWAPLPGSQFAFLRSKPIFEVCYGGGRGFGKTDCLIADWASDVGKGFGAEYKGILFRKTYKQLGEVIDKTLDMFPKMFPKAKWNGSDYKWTMPGGEKLLLRYIERTSDYINYHGHQYQWIGWEELATWVDPEAYLGMISLCRTNNPNIRRRVRATTNPYGPGHAWVKERFGFPPNSGKISTGVTHYKFINQVTGKEEELSRTGIQGHLIENFVMLHATPDYIKILEESCNNDAQLKAWKDGDWNVVAGGMFNDLWDPKEHVIIDLIDHIPESWRIDRSFDWGSSAPFSVGWWAESDGSDLRLADGRCYSTVRGDLFRIAEWYGWNGKPNKGLHMLAKDISQGIVERELAWGIYGRVKPGPADSSIFDVENGVSIAHDMVRPVLVGGQIYDGIDWYRADKRSGSRKQGWELMRRYFKSAIRTGLPREAPGLFICERCKQFIRTVPMLQRDLDKDPDEVAEGQEDHIADEVRYRVRFEGKRASGGSVDGMPS